MTNALVKQFPVRSGGDDTYRDIFENANIGIFQSTLEGRYIRANAALAKMYGYDTPEIFMSSLTNISEQLYVEKGRRDHFIHHLLEHGEIENFESEVYRQDGSVIVISETARVVPANGHRAAYFEGFVKNITTRKSLESKLLAFNHDLEERVAKRTHELQLEIERRWLTEASLKDALAKAEDAAKAKSQFLASMSHELRTPLNAVIGFADAIKSEIVGPIEPPQYAEYVKIIQNSGKHLLELINDILDLAKIESGKVDLTLAPLNLETIMDECLDLIGHRAEEAKIDLTGRVQEGLDPYLHGDARRIKQIFLNLLSNAIKFTPENGAISCCLSKDVAGVLTIRVSDTGVGIAAEDIPKVLSAYGQAEHGLDHIIEGTGLGLPISKKLAELHGGALNIESALGKGTTIVVTLPAEKT